jgi:hypothetical protein
MGVNELILPNIGDDVEFCFATLRRVVIELSPLLPANAASR